MEEVAETLTDVSKYSFYFWNSHAIKAIGTNRNESLPKNKSEQNRKETECIVKMT